MESNDDKLPNTSNDENKCKLMVHNFSEKLMDSAVHFYVLKMAESFMLWIGTQPPKMSAMAVAIKTKFDDVPMATSIMGEFTEAPSSSLAQKLAKRTGKQVFISYNLPSTDLMLLPLVEKRIIKEMTENVDMF